MTAKTLDPTIFLHDGAIPLSQLIRETLKGSRPNQSPETLRLELVDLRAALTQAEAREQEVAAWDDVMANQEAHRDAQEVWDRYVSRRADYDKRKEQYDLAVALLGVLKFPEDGEKLEQRMRRRIESDRINWLDEPHTPVRLSPEDYRRVELKNAAFRVKRLLRDIANCERKIKEAEEYAEWEAKMLAAFGLTPTDAS